MGTREEIERFLDGDLFAVAGASSRRWKYGNKCLRCYQQNGRRVVAIHPLEREVEGAPCYSDLASVPEPVHALSIITPPEVTLRLVEDAAAVGIGHVWMQPGAESPEAIARARALGMGVIANGPCLLVVLGFRE